MNDYGKTRIRYVVFIAAALLAVLFAIEYTTRQLNRSPGQQPITDPLITKTYPELYKAVYNRSSSGLRPFLNHESEAVQRQAWRALAASPVDSLDGLIREVKEADTEEAWFALGMQPLLDAQLRELEELWMQEPEKRAGPSLVLGRQGDERTLGFLLSHQQEAAGSSYEYAYALALGRLMAQYSVESDEQLSVISQAFEAADPAVTRAYLYGFYRGETQKLNTEGADSLYQKWKLYGPGKDVHIDQYIARILKQRVFYEIALYYNSEELLERRVQLSIELARVLAELNLTQNTALAAKILVIHPNPQVVQQTLSSLKGKLEEGSHLFTYITQDILNNEQAEVLVWLQALETLAEVDPGLIDKHAEKLEQIRSGYPYMLPRVLDILKINNSSADFLDLIASIVRNRDPLQAQLAIQALSGYWTELPESKRNTQLAENAREIVFEALSLSDRGIAYTTQNLLMQEDLFSPGDFSRINRQLTSFRLPEDIEVYQAFGSLYKDRFEDQARPVIDSLAALGYVPLNRSLYQAGWDVEVPDVVQQEFRTVNWEQLWQMGRKPVWVLVTEKGTIKIQTDVLSAPATVSAIDSLTRAGAYDGVPFHRVVPNFVIQGGDVERQDGFGGPDFVIPTEPVEAEFRRGAAGIASAGRDTEGSQYFFMHQWSPHLNGRYTLFGYVVEGMDVVDLMVEGDRVERAYWER